MNAPLFDAPIGTAVISECLRYRYRLTRTLGQGKRIACFVMLNPSTADANVNDATIRRAIGFASSWGCGELLAVNLFAWRATEPWELHGAPDPIGPKNMDHVISSACRTHESGGPVVLAWGTHGGYMNQDARVIDRLADLQIPLQCLGTTAEGMPRHPLYLKKDTALEPFYRRSKGG